MRIKIEICYIGTAYNGWQVQEGKPTVQACVQEAIFALTGEHVKVYASGRTDAGVHALRQVAHFDTAYSIAPAKIAFALNQHLPNDIRIISSEQVADNFNARFDVKRKTYVYKFYNAQIARPFDYERSHQVPFVLDVGKMEQCTALFIGTHDFTAFCKVGKEEKDRVRTIFACKLTQTDSIHYEVEICGNGFLHNMVRIIVGTIIDVGLGKIELSAIAKLLAEKSTARSEAGRTLPPYGLYLKQVEY